MSVFEEDTYVSTEAQKRWQSTLIATVLLTATLIAPQTALALSSDSSLVAPIGDSCPSYAPVIVLLQSDGTYAKGIYPANHSLYSEITPDECYRTIEDAVVLSGSPLAAMLTGWHKSGNTWYYLQPLSNKTCPSYAPIKGNINSKGEKIYRTFSSATYDRTRPEACFATTTAASNAGYRAARD